MNLNIKIAVASLLDKTGIVAAVRNYRSARSGIVLGLHRVLPETDLQDSFEPEIAISDAVFEQLLILLRKEFRIVGLQQLLDQPGDIDGRLRVALTFDDGWHDTYTNAFPLLLRYQVPATVFLCPGLLQEGEVLPEERFVRIWRSCVSRGQLPLLLADLEKWGLHGSSSQDGHTWSKLLKRFPLDAKLLLLNHLEKAYRVALPSHRRFLNWEEARIMQRSGICFGSHTVRHSTLATEQQPTLQQELVQSRQAIERRLGQPARFLAYPNGSYDERVTAAARQAGYSHAFTIEPGAVTRKTDRFAMPRICVADSVLTNQAAELHLSRARFHLQRFGKLAS
jgi:peptidoglycan/xylan/chitin deacetylase (PgdA/CDA1 family)